MEAVGQNTSKRDKWLQYWVSSQQCRSQTSCTSPESRVPLSPPSPFVISLSIIVRPFSWDAVSWCSVLQVHDCWLQQVVWRPSTLLLMAEGGLPPRHPECALSWHSGWCTWPCPLLWVMWLGRTWSGQLAVLGALLPPRYEQHGVPSDSRCSVSPLGDLSRFWCVALGDPSGLQHPTQGFLNCRENFSLTHARAHSRQVCSKAGAWPFENLPRWF